MNLITKPPGPVWRFFYRRFLVGGIAMPLLRLIGLALFITAIFLALAAAITKTTHIRIQLPGTNNTVPNPISAGSAVLPPPLGQPLGQPLGPGLDSELPTAESDAVQFTSVPIVWPLIVAAGAGLLIWFTLTSDTQRTSSAYSKRRSRRRR